MSHRSQKLTAVLVTHEEAATLERTLASLAWVDEIVVVDRGSQDDTLAIARRHTERVFYHPSQDMAVLRVFAVSMASHPWVLMLSPGEWVDPMLAHKVDGLLLSASREQGALIPLHTLWQGQRLRHKSQTRLECRLFRREAAHYVEDADAHDFTGGFAVEGPLLTLDAPILAEPAQTLTQWVARTQRRAERRAGFWVETGAFRALGKPNAWGLWREFERTLRTAFLFQGGLFQGVEGLMVSLALAAEALLARLRARELVHGISAPSAASGGP